MGTAGLDFVEHPGLTIDQYRVSRRRVLEEILRGVRKHLQFFVGELVEIGRMWWCAWFSSRSTFLTLGFALPLRERDLESCSLGTRTNRGDPCDVILGVLALSCALSGESDGGA